MPYIPYSLSDEEEQKKNQANASENISGVSNSFVGQGATTTKAPQKSGSFTNLDSYLNANKDNAEGMGNIVADNITGQGDKARTGIQSTQSDFNSLADAGTLSNLGTAKDEVNSITSKARNGAVDSQINDNEVNRFKDISNASYKGPASLDASTKYADTQSSINKANEYKQNAYTDEGRFNLLSDMFARPTYSQGQKKLDNLLLTGNEQAKTNINNAATSLSDIQGLWDTANTNASTLANTRKTQVDNTRNYAQETLGKNRKDRNTEVNSDLDAIQLNWAIDYNKYNSLLSNGASNITPEQMAKLGLTSNGQGTQYVLNNAPVENYLDLATYDAGKVVSKDQYSQLAALDRLASQYGSAGLSKFTDEKQAGTLGLDNNFSAMRFGSTANEVETMMEQQRASALEKLIQGYGARHGGVNEWDVHWANENLDKVLNDPSQAAYWGIPSGTDNKNALNALLNKYKK